MSNFNFEDYRQPWETGPHWELKREFMEKYQNDFPGDRLLCLAQAYSNIELLHCSYPAPVMLQICELSKSLHGCRRFREASKLKEEERNSSQQARKGKRNIPNAEDLPFKFIKFHSAVTTKSLDDPQSSENKISSTDDSKNSENKPRPCKKKNACKLDINNAVDVGCIIESDDSSFFLHITNSPDLNKIKNIADAIMSTPARKRNVAEIALNDTTNAASYKFYTHSFENMPVSFCKIFIGNTLVSIGRDNNERNAKIKADDYAMEIFSNLYNLPCKTMNDLKPYWLGNNINFPLQHTNCCKKDAIRTSVDEINLHFWLNLAQEVQKQVKKKKLLATQILENATKSIDTPHIFYFNFTEDWNTPLHSRTFCCSLIVEKTVLCEGKDSSKKKAKSKASENGVICMLNLLKWHEEHIEHFPKFEEVQSTLSAEPYSKENNSRGSPSTYSESKDSILPDTNLCDISLNNEINESGGFSLFKTFDEAKAERKIKKNKLKLLRETISKKRKVKEAHSLSKTINCDAAISSQTYNHESEISSKIRNTNANAQTKPFPFTLNRILLHNSFSKQLALFDASAIFPTGQDTPLSMLNYSAAYCQKKMSYETESLSTSEEITTFRFHVSFDGEVIGTGEALTKTEAKLIAAHCAVENLKKTVYTIKVKNELQDGFVISRKQVLDHNFSTNALTDNNIGCKMLKMMGWSGGSIGNNGGITEPITASDNHFHRGLGFSKTSTDKRNFCQKIETLLKDFSQSNTTSDLIFSTDFSKEERKDIHRITLKYHLNSTSRGKGLERQLFVKRKIPINELLNLIIQAGGSTSKYEMVDCSLE